MRIKGSVLKARMLWLTEQGGDAASRVLAELADDDRQAVEAGFLSTAWYPVELHNRLVETIDRVLGEGDGKLYTVLGRDSCQRNLTTIYRVFLRAGGMQIMVRRVAQGWRVHYDDGNMAVVDSGKRSVHLCITDVPTPATSHCMPIFGWLGRAIELAGYENIRGRVLSCRLRGGTSCEFLYVWD